MQRRTFVSSFVGLALAPSLADSQILGDACEADPAEARGAFTIAFGAPRPGLWFVATRHSDKLGSQTFRTVADVMESTSPTLAIVEGLETAAGENSGAETLRSLEDSTFRGGEARYAAMLAARRGIPFVGGEMSAVPLNDALLKAYPREAVIKAYLTRDIFGRARVQPFETEADFRAYIQRAANRLAVTDGRLWDPVLVRGDWFIQTYGLPDGVSDFSAGTPCGTSDSSEVIAKITELRNLHLYELIVAKVRTHARVVVVYGSGHLRALRAPFARTLGPESPWIDIHEQTGRKSI